MNVTEGPGSCKESAMLRIVPGNMSPCSKARVSLLAI